MKFTFDVELVFVTSNFDEVSKVWNELEIFSQVFGYRVSGVKNSKVLTPRPRSRFENLESFWQISRVLY